MDDSLNQLKNQWRDERSSIKNPQQPISDVIERAKKKQKSVLHAHYGNIAVLTLTLIMITAFFYYVTPFRELLSKFGVALMVGGLAVRIVIEIFSSEKSKQISFADPAAENTDSSLRFYQFRKKIHGPVTYTIVALYSIGFYMLTPEFSKYIDLTWLIIYDTSYIIGGVILVTQIRKGIKEEMRILRELTKVREELSGIS